MRFATADTPHSSLKTATEFCQGRGKEMPSANVNMNKPFNNLSDS